jgi:hypothetical protein
MGGLGDFKKAVQPMATVVLANETSNRVMRQRGQLVLSARRISSKTSLNLEAGSDVPSTNPHPEQRGTRSSIRGASAEHRTTPRAKGSIRVASPSPAGAPSAAMELSLVSAPKCSRASASSIARCSLSRRQRSCALW